MFHVSLLKPFLGEPPQFQDPVFEDDGVEEFEVEDIVGHRRVRGQMQYLLKWKHFDAFENTWEPEANLSCDELLAQYKASNDLV